MFASKSRQVMRNARRRAITGLRSGVLSLRDPTTTWVLPGHFYSPVASRAERISFFERESSSAEQLICGIPMRSDEQFDFLEELLPAYRRLDIPEIANSRRYGYRNDYFAFMDGYIYGSILLHKQPRRVIEVGSGFSSALLLDISDEHLDISKMQISFIDPYPDRLRSLVSSHDLRGRLLEVPLQEVPLDYFDDLHAGDILFIDSSHVSKIGSDVNYVVFELLPRLNSGVWIHIHDVFYPYEYPKDWVMEGRSYNEAYLVRAFLQFNSSFQIELFNDYLDSARRSWLDVNMPMCSPGSGKSIWLSRI